METETLEQAVYRDLGVALAEATLDGESPPPPESDTCLTQLPEPSALITSGRDSIIELSRRYAAGPVATGRSATAISHLATSFARGDDLQAVAACLRIASLAKAEPSLVADAWTYLYSQQEPEGSFGLFAAELVMLGRNGESLTMRLAMTVEVLWALASAASGVNAETSHQILA